MTGDLVDLRRHRIRRAGEAARRAGYRTTPPPDAEADRWVCALEVGEDEHGCPVHRFIWSPRKEADDWQFARFGPFDPPPGGDDAGHGAVGERDGQEGKDVAGSVTPLGRAGKPA